MGYSDKQKIYAEYLLKRIGIDDIKKISIYLEILDINYSKLYKSPSDIWYYSSSECISILKDEVDIKKNSELIECINSNSEAISATDLSAFIFCPISYVLKKSFEIKNPTNSLQIKIGEEYHQQLLVAKKRYSRHSDELSSNAQIYSHSLLDEIRKSKLIYSGHSTKKPFYNQAENFIGDPDYIFLSTSNDKFIVEEKFSYKKDPNKLTWEETQDERYNSFDSEELVKRNSNWEQKRSKFHDNHIIQLYSYIRNYPEKVNYGYIVYWFYDFNEEGLYIHKVDIMRIEHNQEYENLYKDTLNSINLLRKEKQAQFSTQKINHRQCVKCSVNKYCGHKNEKYDVCSLPYDKEHLKLFKVDFPELLKKAQ